MIWFHIIGDRWFYRWFHLRLEFGLGWAVLVAIAGIYVVLR